MFYNLWHCYYWCHCRLKIDLLKMCINDGFWLVIMYTNDEHINNDKVYQKVIFFFFFWWTFIDLIDCDLLHRYSDTCAKVSISIFFFVVQIVKLVFKCLFPIIFYDEFSIIWSYLKCSKTFFLTKSSMNQIQSTNRTKNYQPIYI